MQFITQDEDGLIWLFEGSGNDKLHLSVKVGTCCIFFLPYFKASDLVHVTNFLSFFLSFLLSFFLSFLIYFAFAQHHAT